MERARSLNFPRNPQNIEDMDQAIQSFRGSIGFYRGSVNWGIEKAFIFLTEHQIMLLQQCDVLFIDATFKTAPNHSYQILNFAIKHGGFFFAGHVIMTSKTESLYKKVFEKILELTNTRPTTVMCDFERGLRSAVREIFNGSAVKGCFFHFSNSIVKKVAGSGLSTSYRNDQFFREYCHKLMALALLPPQDIESAFNAISMNRNLVLNPQYAEFKTYFDRNWLRAYGPREFSVFGCSDRTNNGIESLHKTLARKIGKNPNLFILISRLKDLLTLQEREFVQHDNGRQIRRAPNLKEIYKNRQISAATTALIENRINSFEFLARTKRVMGQFADMSLLDRARVDMPLHEQVTVNESDNNDVAELLIDSDPINDQSVSEVNNLDEEVNFDRLELDNESENSLDSLPQIPTLGDSLMAITLESNPHFMCSICMEMNGHCFVLNCGHGG